MALRNGAIGWSLAGQSLEHGRDRRFPEVSSDRQEEARAAARAVAYRAGVKHIDPRGLTLLSRDVGRTLYRFDVRTPEEFATGHIEGFRSAPGGRLVQETDVFAPVRGARIVLADDKGARADMSASWLAQMGWDVYVLEGGFGARMARGPWRPTLPALPHVPTIAAAALADLGADAVIIDLAASPVHRKGHIPGAWFAVRAGLSEALSALPSKGDLVLTSTDGALARLAAPELATLASRAIPCARGRDRGLDRGGSSTGNRPAASGQPTARRLPPPLRGDGQRIRGHAGLS